MDITIKSIGGFTLVEISIVVIIIGLLVGGIFGGMKLIDNMKVNRVIQNLRTLETAAFTFKDTYGRLPGDMPNAAARLPNCTVIPCATGGDGNRQVGSTVWNAAIVATDEQFTFWHHLQAADLISMGIKNSTDMNFGEGQPRAPFGGGYRIFRHIGVAFLEPGTTPFAGSGLSIVPNPSSAHGIERSASCEYLKSIDTKIDDGFVYDGIVKSRFCGAAIPNSPYTSRSGNLYYDFKGF